MKQIINKLFKKPPSEFYMSFTRAVHHRGCVAWVEHTREIKDTNWAGISHASTDGSQTKLILLPGDDHSQVNEKNLIGFEPLNRVYRRELEKVRSKITKDHAKNKA